MTLLTAQYDAQRRRFLRQHRWVAVVRFDKAPSGSPRFDVLVAIRCRLSGQADALPVCLRTVQSALTELGKAEHVLRHTT